MCYMFEVALKKLWKKKYLYLIVISQIALGIYLLSSSLDDLWVNREEYKQARSKLNEHSISIIATMPEDIDAVDSVEVADYVRLKAKFAQKLELNLIKLLRCTYIYGLEGGGIDQVNLNLVFAEPGYRGLDLGSNQAYVGTKAQHNLALFQSLQPQAAGEGDITAGRYLDCIGLDIKVNEQQLLLDGKSYAIKSISESMSKDLLQKEIIGRSIASVLPEDAVILPLADFAAYQHYVEEAENSMLTAKQDLVVSGSELDTSSLYDFLNNLRAIKQGKVIFRVGVEYLQLKETALQLLGDTMNNLVLAGTQLLLVALSAAGIIYLIILKRIRSIAICIMLGSTKRRQIMELLVEVYTVTWLGVLSGLAVYYGKHFGGENVLLANTCWTVLLTGLAIGALASSLALLGIKKLTPIEILQKI